MSKTALELSPREWQRYHLAEAIVRRKHHDQAQVEKRKQHAWQLARQAAELLRNDFGAGKVVVFGSLAHEAWFTPWSDIDLAAWGIPADRFYSAVGSIAEFSTEFKIDLIDPEMCRPLLRQMIELEGIEI